MQLYIWFILIVSYSRLILTFTSTVHFFLFPGMTTLYEKLNFPFGIGYTWIGAMIIVSERNCCFSEIFLQNYIFLSYSSGTLSIVHSGDVVRSSWDIRRYWTERWIQTVLIRRVLSTSTRMMIQAVILIEIRQLTMTTTIK